MLTLLLTGLLVTNGVQATAGVSEIPSAQAPASWVDNMNAVWSLEEASGATRAAAGSCGSSCNLSPSGSPGRTTMRIEKLYSAVYGASNDALTCTNANCGTALGPASSGGTGGSVSYGCWINFGSTGATPISRLSASKGYALDMQTDGAFARIPTCTIDATSAVYNDGTDYTNKAWRHWVCRFDDDANTLNLYRNATSVASATPSSITSVSATFSLGLQALTTTLDECFVYKGALTAKDICRICSCGIDGSFCSYFTATDTWADKGRNATLCDSCTLPTSPTGAMGAS